MAISYNPSSVTSGLVLCLDAANRKSYPGSGTTWTDLSGRGNNGTLVNGVGYSSANGGSLVFDGTNDYVNITSSNSLNITGDLTLSSWVYFTGNSGTWRVILSKNYGINNATYEIGIGNTALFYYYGYPVTVYGTTTILLNTWYNLAITINSVDKTGVLYINKIVEFNMSGLSTVVTNSNPLYVGVDAPTGLYDGFFLNGNIAQVSIYNRALSAAEIKQNFNATKSRYGL